jgi:hypothetical protein
MRELLRDGIRDPVGDLYVQDSEANVSVKQRHRAATLPVVSVLQPRSSSTSRAMAWAMMGSSSTMRTLFFIGIQRGALPIVPAPRPLVSVNVNNYVNLKWDGLIVGWVLAYLQRRNRAVRLGSA